MRRQKFLILLLLTFCVTFASVGICFSEPPKPQFKADKELCALMMRFGKEAFARARFADAKYYFQMAVQADPGSETAWNHYDLASIYTLANQMKTEGKYVFRPPRPSVQPKAPIEQKNVSEASQPITEGKDAPPGAAPGSPPPDDGDTPPETPDEGPPSEPSDSSGFSIADDEGC